MSLFFLCDFLEKQGEAYQEFWKKVRVLDWMCFLRMSKIKNEFDNVAQFDWFDS